MDGYDTTVELDCGCNVRLNSRAGVPMLKAGDWTSCFEHSAKEEGAYLRRARDRRVVAVRPDAEGATGSDARAVVEQMWPKRHGSPAFRSSLRRLVRLLRTTRNG